MYYYREQERNMEIRERERHTELIERGGEREKEKREARTELLRLHSPA